MSEKITMKRLDQLAELEELATPGPLDVSGGIGFPDDPQRRTRSVWGPTAPGRQSGYCVADFRGPNADANAHRFVAQSNALPALIEAARARPECCPGCPDCLGIGVKAQLIGNQQDIAELKAENRRLRERLHDRESSLRACVNGHGFTTQDRSQPFGHTLCPLCAAQEENAKLRTMLAESAEKWGHSAVNAGALEIENAKLRELLQENRWRWRQTGHVTGIEECIDCEYARGNGHATGCMAGAALGES